MHSTGTRASDPFRETLPGDKGAGTAARGVPRAQAAPACLVALKRCCREGSRLTTAARGAPGASQKPCLLLSNTHQRPLAPPHMQKPARAQVSIYGEIYFLLAKMSVE